MKTTSIVTVLFAVGVCCSQAFEVRQEFRPERFARGNVNLLPLQAIDEAAWVWLDGVGVAKGDYTPFVRFRKEFDAVAGEPLRFDVSADARFVLLLDGREIARGPHKGVVNHWYYETYAVTALEPGGHRMEAVVFDPGWKGARSILSSGQNGFVLRAEGAYDAALTTGKAKWRAAELKSIRYGRQTDPDTMTGSETVSTGTGFLDAEPAADAWCAVTVVKAPVRLSEYGSRPEGWSLFPTERPDQISRRRTDGTIRAAQTAFDEKDLLYSQADAADGRTGELQRLLKEGRPFAVPAKSKLRFLWDLDDYCCAFPELEVSGGKGAKIRWSWTESLYATNIVGHLYLNKGNRDVFVGKRVYRSMGDTFLCDGRARATFTTPWWRSGRWVEIAVETGDAPLELKRLAIVESRYPLEPEMRFACDDPSLAAVQRICVRGLQNCLHEMFMDCPYYEQQMYPGDGRLHFQTAGLFDLEDRLVRHAITLYDLDRRENGMISMNCPTRGTQDALGFTACEVLMHGDYMMYHANRRWLEARLPGANHTLMGFDAFLREDGLLGATPGWNFVDWVPRWGDGVPPDGNGERPNAEINLQYLHAVLAVAECEKAVGHEYLARYWFGRAEKLRKAIKAAFWCPEKSLFASTVDKKDFSEHSQSQALLCDVVTGAEAEACFKALVETPDLDRGTIYYKHYLFETFVKFGRGDLIFKNLGFWKDCVNWHLSTILETPDTNSRSDCHGWGAHPLWHLHTGIAGVKSAAPFYGKVLVAPQPGHLKFIRSATPTPKGMVELDLRFDGGKATGKVTLPAGLDGMFEWKGAKKPLKSGVNEI